LTVVVWAVTGPMFHYSDTWQLVINTGTTIVTFLMVFLIQNTQNRDGAALQTKLDELIRATTDAENEFIGIEALTDKELEAMHARCKARAERSMRALQRAAAEKDARAARLAQSHKASKGDKKEASAQAKATRRAKAVRAGHPHA
jgi:low affinity Fe/Cu permease